MNATASLSHIQGEQFFGQSVPELLMSGHRRMNLVEEITIRRTFFNESSRAINHRQSVFSTQINQDSAIHRDQLGSSNSIKINRCRKHQDNWLGTQLAGQSDECVEGGTIALESDPSLPTHADGTHIALGPAYCRRTQERREHSRRDSIQRQKMTLSATSLQGSVGLKQITPQGGDHHKVRLNSAPHILKCLQRLK